MGVQGPQPMPGVWGCPPLNPLILSLSKDPFLEEGGWGDGQLAETSLHGGLDGPGLPRTGHHEPDGTQKAGIVTGTGRDSIGEL